jgi:YesN/AraC family two-component response regulator
LGGPGDGFTVVSAMRHAQPQALTLLVSGYPDVQEAMATIVLEADEIVLKPLQTSQFMDLIRDRLVNHKPMKRMEKEKVAEILQRNVDLITKDWLGRVGKNSILSVKSLSDQDRTGHIPKLIVDLVNRPAC